MLRSKGLLHWAFRLVRLENSLMGEFPSKLSVVTCFLKRALWVDIQKCVSCYGTQFCENGTLSFKRNKKSCFEFELWTERQFSINTAIITEQQQISNNRPCAATFSPRFLTVLFCVCLSMKALICKLSVRNHHRHAN